MHDARSPSPAMQSPLCRDSTSMPHCRPELVRRRAIPLHSFCASCLDVCAREQCYNAVLPSPGPTWQHHDIALLPLRTSRRRPERDLSRLPGRQEYRGHDRFPCRRIYIPHGFTPLLPSVAEVFDIRPQISALVIPLAMHPLSDPPSPLRRLPVREPAQQLRPPLEHFVLHGVAYTEVRGPLAEHGTGDDEDFIQSPYRPDP
jgi:hypothetical protein